MKKGDPIILIDRNFLLSEGIDLSTMVVITNSNDTEFNKINIGQEVCKGTAIFESK